MGEWSIPIWLSQMLFGAADRRWLAGETDWRKQAMAGGVGNLWGYSFDPNNPGAGAIPSVNLMPTGLAGGESGTTAYLAPQSATYGGTDYPGKGYTGGSSLDTWAPNRPRMEATADYIEGNQALISNWSEPAMRVNQNIQDIANKMIEAPWEEITEADWMGNYDPEELNALGATMAAGLRGGAGTMMDYGLAENVRNMLAERRGGWTGLAEGAKGFMPDITNWEMSQRASTLGGLAAATRSGQDQMAQRIRAMGGSPEEVTARLLAAGASGSREAGLQALQAESGIAGQALAQRQAQGQTLAGLTGLEGQLAMSEAQTLSDALKTSAGLASQTTLGAAGLQADLAKAAAESQTALAPTRLAAEKLNQTGAYERSGLIAPLLTAANAGVQGQQEVVNEASRIAADLGLNWETLDDNARNAIMNALLGFQSDYLPWTDIVSAGVGAARETA